MRIRRVVVTVLVLALLVAGCASTPSVPVSTPAPIWDLVVVDESLQADLEIGAEIALAGLGFTTADGTRLCQASMDSRPPICDGARVVLLGADLAGLPTAETLGGVTWAESIVASGTWEGDGLRVDRVESIITGEPAALGGTVIVEAGAAVLCPRISDAEPPECLVTGIPLLGLDATRLPDAETVAGITWATQVLVVGTWGEGLDVSSVESAR